jgi:hypothetical protein
MKMADQEIEQQVGWPRIAASHAFSILGFQPVQKPPTIHATSGASGIHEQPLGGRHAKDEHDG